MKLLSLLENLGIADLISQQANTYFYKKAADPNRPEKSGHSGNEMLPARSGTHNTPMKQRHRKFFNAPTGSLETKTSRRGEIDDYGSRRPRSIEPKSTYPKDYGPGEKEFEDALADYVPINVRNPKPYGQDRHQ